jgi:peptidoglycan/LPS O-acetylase OafA/YrhL
VLQEQVVNLRPDQIEITLTTTAFQTRSESPSPVMSKEDASRLPSLDGLRAISIVLVFVGHLTGTKGFPSIPQIGDYAHLGVVVFFVISGFLITRLMLLEHEKFGNISLGLFYARRALRLLPAAYAYTFCVALMWATGFAHLHTRDMLHALTYTVNYEIDRPWALGHLWSLSIEEQFYFLWPFTFVLLRPHRVGWAAFGAMLLGPIARVAMLFLFRGSPYRDLEIFPVVADSLATGCMLAIIRGWLEGKTWYLRLFKPAYSVGLIVLVFVVNHFMGYGVPIALGTSVINICLAILIHRSVYCHSDLFGRFLNWKPVAFVGVLSYSLYLWQQLFLNRTSASWVCAFPLNLVFAVSVALASYYLLETPLLKLRHKLRIRRPKADLLPLSLEECQPEN